MGHRQQLGPGTMPVDGQQRIFYFFVQRWMLSLEVYGTVVDRRPRWRMRRPRIDDTWAHWLLGGNTPL